MQKHAPGCYIEGEVKRTMHDQLDLVYRDVLEGYSARLLVMSAKSIRLPPFHLFSQDFDPPEATSEAKPKVLRPGPKSLKPVPKSLKPGPKTLKPGPKTLKPGPKP